MRPFVRTKLVTLFLALGLALDAHARAQLPAFPGAVGFGASATGGRGGVVLHVTTLAASGQGSLAWAASQTGPRIIVFDVSGVIEGDVEITHGDVTIAGQTAPGAGITINGHLFTPYGDVVSNIIVRFVRVRPNGTDATWEPAGHDAIQMSDVDRAIFDHVDASHGIDEIVDHWNGATNVTWQRSVLAFPNPAGGHPDGAHPFCLINSEGEDGAPNGGRITITGNLFAHCRTRTPALGVGPAEVIGNVVYDGREGFVHHNAAYGDFFIAGNVYIDGPSNTLLPLWFDPENDDPPTRYFLADNLVEDPGEYEGVLAGSPFDDAAYASTYTFALDSLGASQFHPASAAPGFGGPGYLMPLVPSSSTVESAVLTCAGAFPRDHIAQTAIDETTARTGMVRNLALGSLLQGLTPTAPPTDSDDDGMPDAWESAHGLDENVDDHLAVRDRWPALELYLAERASTLSGCDPIGSGPGSDAGVGGLDGGSDAGPGGSESGGGCGCTTQGATRSSDPACVLIVLGLVAAWWRHRCARKKAR